MSRRVTYVKTHQPTFVPNVGNLKDTLTTEGSQGLIGAIMTHTSDGIEIEYKGVNFLVPLVNVQLLVYAEDKIKKSK